MPIDIIGATPESLAEVVASLPPGDRARFDAALQNYATARNVPSGEDDHRLTTEDMEAIGEGLADLDAGRTVSGEEVFAKARERYGWTK